MNRHAAVSVCAFVVVVSLLGCSKDVATPTPSLERKPEANEPPSTVVVEEGEAEGASRKPTLEDASEPEGQPEHNDEDSDSQESSVPKNDGRRITSERTRIKDEKPETQPTSFPKPQASNRSYVEKLLEQDGHDLAILDIKPSGYELPLVYNAAGTAFFVVDDSNVLHRISTANLKETASLQLKGDCFDFALSQFGLFVALPLAHAVWLVDSDSLEVKRQFSQIRPRRVAASPKSNLGFVAYNGTISQPTDLLVVDLKTGRRIHGIGKSFGTDPRMENYKFLLKDNFTYDLEMSRDGKYFYMLQQNGILRFRIDGLDLVFEERSPALTRKHFPHLVVSHDNKFCAVSERTSGRAVHDPLRLENELYKLSRKTRSIGFDPKTTHSYLLNNGEIVVLDADWTTRRKLRLPSSHVVRIAVDPRGERFVCECGSKVVYCDTVGGRMMDIEVN